MKRIFLLFLLLMLLAASAFASFDPSPYRIDNAYGARILPLEQNRILLSNTLPYSNSPDFTGIRILENGKTVQSIPVDIPLEKATSGWQYAFFPYRLADGSLHYCIRENSTYSLFDIEGNQLIKPRILTETGSDIYIAEDCYAVIDTPQGENAVLSLYDMQERQYLTGLLPDAKARLCALIPDNDAHLLLIELSKGQTIAARISRDGRLLWQYYPPASDALYGFRQMAPDGTGGAYLFGVHMQKDNYNAQRVVHVTADGTLDWERILSVPKANIQPLASFADHRTGTTTVYGRAVAVSRSLYAAFALTLSPDGTIHSLDVRDFSCSQDYGFTIKTAPKQTVYLHAQAADVWSESALLVPFDALPALNDPGFSLQ